MRSLRRRCARAQQRVRNGPHSRNNKNNEAFLDRIYIVKVPYCLRVGDEVHIYDKLLRNSSLSEAPCAPGTLPMLAQFSVLTRIKEPETPASSRRCAFTTARIWATPTPRPSRSRSTATPRAWTRA